MRNADHKEKLIEVWGDVVDVMSMVKAFGISIVCTMGLFFLAPKGNRPLQLLFGLGGACLGFIMNAVLFKPKRKITTEEDDYAN